MNYAMLCYVLFFQNEIVRTHIYKYYHRNIEEELQEWLTALRFHVQFLLLLFIFSHFIINDDNNNNNKKKK